MGYILSPVVWVKDQCTNAWKDYIALVGVAEENTRLREELRAAHGLANLTAEERAELERLRNLLRLDALYEQPAFAARVIAKRFGPQAVLKTFTVNKGYLDGAIAGTPVVTQEGVVGRVLRTAPHAATVLMVSDPGFRLAVISQKSRTPGILTGSSSPDRRLEVAYVSQTAQISVGETLVTAGVDGAFPKGIPVGVVSMVSPGNEILFQQVHAQPVVNLDLLEEVLLLQQTGSAPLLRKRLDKPAEENSPIPYPNETNSASPAGQSATQPAPAPAFIRQAALPSGRNTASPSDRPLSRIDALQPPVLQNPPSAGNPRSTQ